MPQVLGVDSTALGTAVEIRDADTGKVYASGRAVHPPGDALPDEQDPAVWWQGLVEARHDAGGALGVAAVSVAAAPGLVTLDAERRVLGPALLTGPREASVDAARLAGALADESEWAVEVGTIPDASTLITQLAWLRRVDRDRFASTAMVLTPHDWLTYRLTRRFVTDRGDASETGYWSPRENRWRTDLLALVDETKDWGSCVPHVSAPQERAGDREGVIIGPGTGRTMGAALGVDLQPRDLVVALDQTARVFTVRERPTEDPTGTVAGLADATGRFLPTVRLRNGLNVLDAMARVLGVDRSRFDQLALGASPGAGGVTLVPYFNGARVPARPDATGLLAGLSADVTPEEVARAAVEGVVCALLDAVDALRAADVPVGPRVALIGAGARMHAVQRVLADLSERVVMLSTGDRAAVGACVQAAAVLHGRPPDEVAAAWELAPTREIEPDPRVDAAAVREQFRDAVPPA
jgi:xylulokinase